MSSPPASPPVARSSSFLHARCFPYLFLAFLALVFFADLVLHPTQVLYSDTSDFLALHLPDKHFLVRSWQETGELPLWCPYRFAGMPFLADIQVAAFYPLHWPLFLLPEEFLGAALSWLVVVHVAIAGWGMYAYARSRALDLAPALIAAIGFMFAGKWLLHVLAGGHYNMLMLAWLPYAVLFLERALARPTLFSALCWAVGAGVCFALFVLAAYPYVTLYAGLFLAVWTLSPALEQAGYLDGKKARSRRGTLLALGHWLILGLVAALIGSGLGAVQLLPALEMAEHATRGAGVGKRNLLGEGLVSLLSLVGPSVARHPETLIWELRGGLGVLWLGLAVLAPVLGRGQVRFQAAVAACFAFLALGGAGLLSGLPGFDLFRLPSRIFLVVSFPVAYLAGVTTQVLFAWPGPSPEVRRRCRIVFLLTLTIALCLVGLGALLAAARQDLRPHIYWGTLVAGVLILFSLLGDRPGNYLVGKKVVWMAVLLVDLWAISWQHVAVRPEAEIYPVSDSVRYVAEPRGGPCRVFDHLNAAEDLNSPLGTGAPLAPLQRVESLRDFNPMDVRRYKEYLQFIADKDEPLALGKNPFADPLMGDFPVRNPSLLDLLGVRYLLQPSDWQLDQDVAGGTPWSKVAQDPYARAFNPSRGEGVEVLKPYTVYENNRAFPRAFVVGEAARLPDRAHVLEALKTTPFTRRVLLEDIPTDAPPGTAVAYRPAEVVAYQPNRVLLRVPDGPGGYLVLTDVWFPGWQGAVDGQPVSVYRANYLFRAVPVAAGAHEVVFTFEPGSYRWGKALSLATLGLVAGLGLGMFVRWLKIRRDQQRGVSGSSL